MMPAPITVTFKSFPILSRERDAASRSGVQARATRLFLDMWVLRM
jgi:hypothetical protein